MRKPSFGLDADPWNSPDLHKGHSHRVSASNTLRQNGNGAAAPALPNGNGFPRTTSTFTTTADQAESTASGDTLGKNTPSTGDGAGWGGFGEPTGNGFANAGLGVGGGFGVPPVEGDGNNDPTGLGRSLGSGRVANVGTEEVVTITTIPEKEGIFLFQHRNYQVCSARRNAKVVRRYSDFVWLLDCLHKRYPFRQLPLLPPKRVASKSSPLIIPYSDANMDSQWKLSCSRCIIRREAEAGPG